MPDTGLSLTDWLSLIGTVGGSALAAGNGRIGRPLGVGLGTLGGIGLLYGQQEAQRKQQQKLAAMLYNTKDPITGKPDPAYRGAASMVLSGVDINTALKAAQDRQASIQQAGLNQQIGQIAPATGPVEPRNLAIPQLLAGGMAPGEAKTTYDSITGYEKPEKTPFEVDPEGNIIEVKPGMKLPKGSMTLSEFGKPAPKPDKPEKGPMFVGPDGTIIEGRPGAKIPPGSMPASYFGRPKATGKPTLFVSPDGKTFSVTDGTAIPPGSRPVGKFGADKLNEFDFFKDDYLKRNPGATAEDVVGAFSDSKRAEPKPLIIKTPTEVLVVDPTTYETKRTISIPPKVADRKEYSDFAEGYLKDHPKANGAEVATAYTKMKAGAKPAGAWKPPPGLPKEYTPTPSPSLPGAVYLSPKPASGLLSGWTAPTTPLLYIPSTGKYVKPGEEVAPGVVWDGNP